MDTIKDINSEVFAILSKALEHDISVFLENDNLVLKTPKDKKPDPEIIGLLKEYKEEIKSYLINEAKTYQEIKAAKEQILPFDRKSIDKLPLSYAQERLWVVDQLQGSVHYHIPSVLRFDGALDREVLELSFQKIVNRHEVLRTCFKESEGQVYQEILDQNTWSLGFTQQSQSDKDLDENIRTEIDQPFDLSQDHPIRAHLFQISEQEHVLTLTTHHIASDGWSTPIFVQEVAELYQAHQENRAANLNELPIQYADYALWQRNKLNETALAEELSYWETKLADLKPLNLPTDHARPAVPGIEGSALMFQIEQPLTKQLEKLSHQEEVTMFMLLLSVFKVLLYRYTGQQSISVGSPIANRTYEETESLIGFFVNTLVLRSDLDPNLSFQKLLAQVKNTTLEAYSHQEVPFEKILEHVGQGLDRSRNPLYQATFSFHNTPEVPTIELGAAKLRGEEFETKTAKDDLTLHITETGQGMNLQIEYRSDIFEPATIERMKAHYEMLLSAVIENPSTSIDELMMLTPPEAETLLVDFNKTTVDYPHDQSIADLFEQQVAKTPQRTAITFAGKEWTYEMLNEQSNQLAHYLKKTYELQSNDLVGVMMERSAWSIISILGILKAGAAYVPIEVNYPQARKAYMLEDTQVKALIIHSDSMFDVTDLSVNAFAINVQQEELEQESKENPKRKGQQSTDLAYVIYTSGSTGNPKGVLVQQQSVARLVFNESFEFLNENTVVYQYAPLAFDASTFEVWGPLLKGGKLVISSAEMKSLEAIAADLKKESVNTLWLTAGLFHQVVDTCLDVFTSLDYILAGGDSIRTGSIEKVLSAYPKLTFINGYGPTESTTFAIVNRVQASDEIALEKNIIGQPISNTKIYILNANTTDLVPVGVVGEIVIGGAGLARGYLNNPDLTAKKFVDHPFEKGAKVYKTGDYGKWLPSGKIEFIGRKDDQVKIRGYRIELEEIETVLQTFEAVEQCVVLAREDDQKNKRLVAYVVPAGNFEQTKTQDFLKARLPEYMVPAIFVELEKIPLTINGKLDKKALPDPDSTHFITSQFVAPRNETETKIAAIWQEILNLEQVGITDNFFNIGGDSILLIRTLSKFKKELGQEIKVAHFYEAPTIEELSKYFIGEKDAGGNNDALAQEVEKEITQIKADILSQLPNAADIEDVFPMSDIQKGMVFTSLMDLSSSVYHDQFVYQIPAIDEDIFRKAFTLLVQKHTTLRTAFDLDNFEEEVQIIFKERALNLNFTDISTLTPDAQEKLVQDFIVSERKRPFDFSKAPLWRADVFKTNAENIVYLFQFHHAILDGWSLASLNTELGNLIKQLKEDAAFTPNALAVNYKTAVVESLIEKRDPENITFWKNELADYKRLNIFSKEEKEEVFFKTYPENYLPQLKQAAKQHDVSVKALFFGAYLFCLKMLTYENDLTVGMVTNTRPMREDGDKVLGCFLNSVPFRFQMPEKPKATWKDYFQSIEQKLKDLKSKERLTLYEITKMTGENATEGNPFFDTLFTYIDFHVYDNLEMTTNKDMDLESFASTNTYLDITIRSTGDSMSLTCIQSRAMKADFPLTEVGNYFKRSLDCLLENPNAPINTLDIVSEDTRKDLLDTFNQTELAFEEDENILETFAEQVEKVPNAVAVIFQNKEITYAELDERSNLLARYLKKTYDLQSDDLVGIMLDRSDWWMVAILGVMKAGAAYVPIDTEYPTDRKAFILEDTKIKALIIESEHLFEVLEFQVNILSIDIQLDEIVQDETLENVELPSVKLNDLAYVIYTSGSTGKPKGVLIEHRNLAASCFARKAYYGSIESMVLISSFAFDSSIAVIWGTLLTGGALIIPSNEAIKESEQIKQVFSKRPVDAILCVPSYYQFLVDEKIITKSTFKRVILAGEQLTKKLVNRHFSIAKSTLLFNEYGPTEGTVWTSVAQITGAEDIISIGQPIKNVKVYVLDNQEQALPIGMIGELCVGGKQITRGYLNRPELTQERFIPDLFSTEKGARLYKTGDLVRWLPDGNLEFIGRKDDQVKILGYRIELGEIETVISQSTLVHQSVVLVHEDEQENKKLVAYIVAEEKYDKESLQTYLKSQLPPYMVPHLIIALPEMPLTANGKIDKKSLPNPDASLVITNEYVAPRTETEEAVTKIWKQILNEEKIGVHDNFFELGGHSLLAIRMVSSIRKEMSIEVNIMDIFANLTVAELSAFLETQEEKILLPEIEVQERPERIPLSFAQERLWFIDKLEGSVHYHLPLVLRFKGDLNKDFLEQAFVKIINRHEVLRTVVRELEGVAYQEVLGKGKWTLDYQDQVDFANAEAIENYIVEEINQPFDLANDHMLRAKLVAINPEESLLILTTHHIASDGWSTAVFVSEMVELYKSQQVRRAEYLLDLPIQYADYAIWQRNYLQGEVLQEKMGYWEAKLGDVEPINLPTDFARPKEQSTRGKAYNLCLNEDLSQQLQSFSQEQGVTLFMTLLSAINVLLHRYSGQDDIVVGSPIANRTQKEVEPLIGFFINTLVLRSDLAENPSFQDLLTQVKKTTLEAYAHQDVPFEKIVEKVEKTRDRSRSPLFQVMFVLQNNLEIPSFEVEGLDLVAEPYSYDVAKYDLVFNVSETSHGIEINLVYCADLFLPATIEKMMNHFEILLTSMMQNPAEKVSQYGMLTAGEEKQLLTDFNQTAVAYPEDKTIVDVFTAQVAKTPNNAALIFNDTTLTYRELEEQSNQLAHYLMRQGVEKESIVAVCMDRSLETIISVLGIMKAGGAYLPIDADYPAARVQYILENSCTGFILTKETHKALLGEPSNAKLLSLDEEKAVIAKETINPVGVKINPENLAYVIYTSGSTGKPKGVMIEHRSNVNMSLDQVRRFGIEETDKVMQFASLSFDASISEIFMALYCGACLVLPEKGSISASVEFVDSMREQGISVVTLPPAYLSVIDLDQLSFLRVLITAGEAANVEHAVHCAQSSNYFNAYGPTECAVCVSIYQVSEADQGSPQIPIGVPIANTEVFILDPHNQLVPSLLEGEICVGGIGLARGYLYQEELTAEKFIEHPFKPGERLYKTGDRGRWLSNGNLAFSGRKDNQVKIRGFRIELGEVEAVLQQCPAVNQGVVLVKSTAGGDQFLVAYLVAEGDYDKEKIQDYLRAQLPDYMVPNLLVELPELPLNTSGKIDKKALPEPDASTLLTNEYEAPRNETEEKIAAIWQELLNVERVGIRDDFFELGGHSLVATKALFAISKEFSVNIPIKVLFQFSTIAELSEYMEVMSLVKLKRDNKEVQILEL